MTTTRRRFLGLAVTAGGLAACASQKPVWVHPTLPAEEWPIDIASCTRQARRKANDSIADEAVASGVVDPGAADMTTRARLMRRQKDSMETLRARCLRALGYRQTKT